MTLQMAPVAESTLFRIMCEGDVILEFRSLKAQCTKEWGSKDVLCQVITKFNHL